MSVKRRREAHKTTKITLRVSDRLATRLREAAAADDRTLSEHLREVLRRELLTRPTEGGAADGR